MVNSMSKMIRKSNKSEKQLKEEAAEKEMAENPYAEIRLDDYLADEKMKARPKHKAKWERIRQKLG